MKNKRIVLAFIMLLITGVALTTASYAWFSASTQATLGDLDVNVTASNGIQVSTDAETWKGTLSTADIKGAAYAGNKNQIPTTLTPVSTIGSQSIGNFEMFDGIVDEEKATATISTSAAAEETSTTENGHYIAFDLFIKSAAERAIQLDAGSGISAVNAANPDDIASDKGLKYSARVAFFNQGTDATNTPSQAIAQSNGTAASQVIWEPNANMHTVYAENSLGATGIMPYYGVKAEGEDLPFDADSVSKDTTHFGTVTTVTSNVGAVPTETMFTVKPGITKVRIYIWIEGQDIDCENNASVGTGIRTTLKLKAANVTTTTQAAE